MPVFAYQGKTSPEPNLPGIPNELLIYIATFCPPSDHNSLVRTSKEFHAALSKSLYEDNIRNDAATAMFWAARYGRVGTLDRLQSSGAEVNVTFYGSAVDKSPSRGKEAVLAFSRYSRRWRCEVSFTPLHVAAASGQMDVVKCLLARHANIEATATNLCCCRDTRMLVHPFMAQGIPDRIFDLFPNDGVNHDYFGDGDVTGDDYDENRTEFDRVSIPLLHPRLSPCYTPVHLAVCSRQSSTARLLIERGAAVRPDPPASVNLPRTTTLLHTAVRRNNWVTAGYLLEHGLVNPREIDINGSPAIYHAAVHHKRTAALKTLLKHNVGADAPSKICRYRLAESLVIACRVGNFEGALVLLEHGAQWEEPFARQYPVYHIISWHMSNAEPRAYKTLGEKESWKEAGNTLLSRVFQPESGLIGINDPIPTTKHAALSMAVGPSSYNSPFTLKLDLVIALLQLGADANQIDWTGFTPLEAVLVNHKNHVSGSQVVRALLQSGARLDFTSYGGSSVMAMAMEALADTRYGFHDPSLQVIKSHVATLERAESFLSDVAMELYDKNEYPACLLVMETFNEHMAGFRARFSHSKVKELMESSIQEQDTLRINFLNQAFPAIASTQHAL